MPAPRPDPAADLFEAQRPRLLRLGYRMLGSMAEAEDVVQDAWLRWRRVDPATVREPAAFLSRTVTRLCLDALRAARARRETYIGPWLPEPIAEPAEDALRLDELTLTLMMALERLSPLERAAFLLHDVFGTPMEDVAETLGRDPAAIRQLAVRARKHVRDARPRYALPRAEGERMARAFFEASTNGDLAALRAMLAEDVIMRSDGGGKVIAFRNPIAGAERVLRMFGGLLRKFPGRTHTLLRPLWIDGLPGYASRDAKGLLQTTALEIEDGRIVAIYVTRNPDKLGRIERMLAGPA